MHKCAEKAMQVSRELLNELTWTEFVVPGKIEECIEFYKDRSDLILVILPSDAPTRDITHIYGAYLD